ncbi:hypothetical protein [Streptomyces sp. BSE6.1]|uniref:hypothetical protein n=1 Tax=Streptomyces sp. BSE6.1 TaxID=2605730 RepID=UPI001F46AF95|nr:hypothetical protein [Streptomyces sp. BSE6.1]
MQDPAEDRAVMAFRRLMLSLACGTVVGAVTTAIPAAHPWWWAVALGAACLAWFGQSTGSPT